MSDEPCRRRPILAGRGETLPARYLPDRAQPEADAADRPAAQSLRAAGRAQAAAALEAKPLLPKGACPHCGRHIGRGVNFHERRCKANPAPPMASPRQKGVQR